MAVELDRIRVLAWGQFPRVMLWLRYVRHFRRLPHLRQPRRFTERVLVKLLFDRDPRLTLFADKFAVRDYVKAKLGGAEHLTKLYAAIDEPAEIRELSLPNRFVMKPNHMSGAVKIVTDLATIERTELATLAASWLTRNYGREKGEWAYRDIRPQVLFEELLEFEDRSPSDYRIYCFGGEPRFIRVTRDHFGSDPTGTFYDTDFRLLPVALVGSTHRHLADASGPPPNLQGMLEVARTLSADVEFVRVDLYNLGGRIVFGELTNYPAAGVRKFDPPAWDLTFGSYWPPRRPRSASPRPPGPKR